MQAISQEHWTPKEYLTFEQGSPERHELVGGEVYLMTGASENHNLIVANCIFALMGQLRNRRCKVYPSDMLIEIPTHEDYHYPDVSVVCGSAEIKHDQRDILLNPTVIIEVLSASTEQYDRGKKFHNYLSLNSLQDYLLVAQDTRRIERYQRQENGQWLYSEANAPDAAVELESIKATLPLGEVYEKVSFEQE